MQPLLQIRGQARERLGDAPGSIAVAVQRARRISPVFQLARDGGRNLIGDRLYVNHVLVRFAPFLPLAHQHHRCTEVACIADKAA